jgi:lipopolysaccharide/colanic/teichoic acid biosynthesis glycosyltransferase
MFHVYKNSFISLEALPNNIPPKKVDVHQLVVENAGNLVSRFISRYGDPGAPESLVVSTSRAFNVAVQPRWAYRFIVNLQRVNSVRQLCGFLIEVNRKMEENGRFICCLETTHLRRKRIFSTLPVFIRHAGYFFDYLLNRVAPTVRGTRWIYGKLSTRLNRPISYYEMVGRLAYCGFETIADEVIDGRHYLVARKVAEPPIQVREQYGLLVGLDRIGEGGQIIRVYKFRSMVAFSEYVQEHMYKRNRLGDGGKFKNDRRVTILGGLIRRFWIDELPMFFNVLKGEMKLVGVRPVSQQYLSLYDAEVVRLRTSVKPGLIPPFYADLPRTLSEIQESEVRYIRQWQEAPWRTDLVYFFRVLRNVLFRGARSR